MVTREGAPEIYRVDKPGMTTLKGCTGLRYLIREGYLGRQGGEPRGSGRDTRAFSLLFLSEIGDQLDGLCLREFGRESI